MKNNLANENCVTTEASLAGMQARVEELLSEVLDALGIDTERDPNTRQTAARIARMWVREQFAGRYSAAPELTVFPNTARDGQMLVAGPIAVNSTCSHHFAAFTGSCYIGVLPDERLVGLSKYARIVDWFARRPQIQEELTRQIAEYIDDRIAPLGVGVVIRARHSCCSCRGVKDAGMEFSTSAFLGRFKDDTALRTEFFAQAGFFAGRGGL
jgi:GTP cyclohydrolase I